MSKSSSHAGGKKEKDFGARRKSTNMIIGMIQYCIASVCLVSPTSDLGDRRRPKIAGKINGKETQLLLDSGASISLISEDLYDSLWANWKLQKLPLPASLRVTGVTGHNIQLVDYVEATIEILGKEFKRPLLVVKGISHTQAILGWDTIKEEGIILDGANDTIYLAEKKKAKREWASASLATTRRTTISPRSVHKLETAAVIGDKCILEGETGVCEAIPQSVIGLWDSLTEVGKNGKVTVAVVNMSDVDINLEAGDIVGSIHNPEYYGETVSPLNEETIASIFGEIGEEPKEPQRGQLEKQSKEEKENLEKKLRIGAEGPWRQKYLDLIMRYHDVISKDKFDLGHADIIKHSIRMGDQVPSHSRQFRIPFEHETVIHEYVDELLKRGAIEVSRSPYNSAIFCVAKKTPPDHPKGMPLPMRCVLDYRKINEKSLPDRYSIREVREYIDAVGKNKSKVFTAIDLTSGFWQQSLEEESRQYTSFTVPGKGTRYQWRVTPMGLQGSPASFARLMDYIMMGLTNVLTYIDDVLLHTETHEQQLERLEEVLLRLRKYGLKLNGEKTIWGASEVQYLGYTLSAKGVSPSKDKLEAVRLAQPPRNTKQIREFIGLCNYFRFLIKDFSRWASPLTELTKRSNDWKGGELPDKAAGCFKYLKETLCAIPVVGYPDNSGEFHLYTDGCSGDKENRGGLGAVLMQMQEGQEKVLAYASRGLKDHEGNYSAYLLELAAALFGIDHFDVYLRGRKFILFTDHKPLEKLSLVHTKTLGRLQQAMLEYNFETRYKMGKDNAVADYLSRNVVATLTDESGSLAEEQEKEPRIKDVKIFLKEKRLPTHDKRYAQWVRRIGEKCLIKDNVVWYTLIRRGHRTKDVVYAPEIIRDKIVQAAHLSLEAGHGGTTRTYERVLMQYWWPGMSTDVDKLVKFCSRCQQSKSKEPPPAPLQSMPIVEEPNCRVHIDLFGPLKTSKEGNKYVMVMTDAFTKYTELVAIEKKEADIVARAFFERWICRFSAPRLVISDQGKEFCNKVLDGVCERWKIDKKRTSPFHPQTNSSAESYNRTMIKYMRAVLDNNKTLEWEELLPCLSLAYNTHVHRSTLETPFFLTFLHDPRLPFFDLENPRKFYNDSYVEESFKLMQVAYQTAKMNMEEAKTRQEKYFNEKTKERTFEKGEKVLVYFPNVPPGINRKFYKQWREFNVLELVGPVNLKLREAPRKRAVIIHINRIRKLNEAETEIEEQAAYLAVGSEKNFLDREFMKNKLLREQGHEEELEESLPCWAEAGEAVVKEEEEDVFESASESSEEDNEVADETWDPWFAMARRIFPQTAGRAEEKARTRSDGPVADTPLPDKCPLSDFKRKRGGSSSKHSARATKEET
jgi:hypothetical protein